MFTFSNQRPGVVDTSCITVNYTGSLSATVKMHATVSGTLAPYLTTTVTRGSDGTPGFDDCTGFTPDAINYAGLGNGVLFSGALSTFPTTNATGLNDPFAGWTSSTSATYRFTIEIADNNSAQGLNSGASFTWQANS